MWSILAKVGGAVLTGLGVDWAISSYQQSAEEKARQEQNQKIGKGIVGAAALYLGYLLLKKIK